MSLGNAEESLKMLTSMPPKHFFAFGPFLLDADEHRLLREGRAVPLPPKAFDTLLVLVGHSGHILMKDELMKQVWPETYVEENNLQQSISALRKVLEEGSGESRYIENCSTAWLSIYGPC